jgi:methyl-accepting chemotaxis protein
LLPQRYRFTNDRNRGVKVFLLEQACDGALMNPDNFSIRTKLALVVGLFLVPVSLLAWLFVQQSFKDINFAQKERDGIVYLRGTWPVLMSLIAASNDPKATPASHLAGDPKLDELKRFDAAMETEEAAKALTQSLAKIGWPRRSLERNADSEQAIAAARTLLAKIADGSNLTLDPDLDSYYVMDVISTKVPEFVDRLGTLLALARAGRAAPAFSDDEKAELMIQLGQLRAASAGAIASLESAEKGNPDDQVRRNLDALAKSFSGIADGFAAEMKTVASAFRDETKRQKVDLAGLTKLYGSSLAASDAFSLAGIAELDRLLDARISSFTMRLWTMLGIAGLVIAIALATTLLIAQRISQPLRRMTGALDEIAAGQFDLVLPGLGRGDEIGMMARAMDAFKLKAVERARLESDRRAAEERAGAVQHKADMQKLADLFEGSVQGAVEHALDAGNDIGERATSTAERQETVSKRSITVANAAMSTRARLATLSAATHQMSSSITEISRNIAGAAAASSEAVQDADGVSREIGELAESAKQIGAVVQLISDIAGQTNLLALNATIEAARAGEAGRGFSVVATEVKSLAAQTARATLEITQKIEEIQNRATGAVSAVARVRGTIDRVAGMSGSVATAVEEQSAVTADIARNVSVVMTEVDEVSASIGEITRGAIVSCGGAIEVLWAADDLGTTIGSLKGETAKFLVRVRA